jgi:hypothetical protein
MFRNLISCRFKRTLKYRLLCPELTGWLNRLKQFVDLFGVLDPAAVWDVIPWSFVVDWFLPVGRWLHDNRPRLFPAEFEVLDYCESFRIEQHNEFFFVPFRGKYFGGTPTIKGAGTDWDVYGTSIGTERLVTYVRQVMTPETKRITQTSRHPLLRWRNVATSAALTAQRIPRPGLIGEEFDGVDFDTKGALFTPEDVKEAEANARWAAGQKSKRASRIGDNSALWRFELGTRKTTPDLDTVRFQKEKRHRLGSVIVIEDFKLLRARIEAQTEKSALRGVAVDAQEKWVRNRNITGRIITPRY